MSQESFSFNFSENLNVDDFIESSANRAALAFINQWPNWPTHAILLYGEKSCGKTHLAKIWQSLSGAKFLSADEIYNNEYNPSENYIIDVIEDIHDETSLFHLYNKSKEFGGNILFVSSKTPSSLAIRLPDLKSRLNAITHVGVGSPDDDLLKAVLFKMLSDRQLKVEIEVINYIVARMERSFEAAKKNVDIIDKKALSMHKNITIPFVRDVLAIS